jgi:putative transposase
MLYHYTFNTYNGIPLLEDQGIRGFLLKLFQDIAYDKGFKIIEMEILADHVHMLIEQPYTISISLVMKYIKGASARSLFNKYPTNRFDIRKLWARSYNCRKIKVNQTETVVDYIRNQRGSDGIDKRY